MARLTMSIVVLRAPTCALALAVLSGLFRFADARDFGQYAQVPQDLREWFGALKNKNNILCCADADGYDAQWDTAQGHYRVFSKDGWIVVPDDAVVTGPNKALVSKVWWKFDEAGKRSVRCFMPGLEA